MAETTYADVRGRILREGVILRGDLGIVLAHARKVLSEYTREDALALMIAWLEHSERFPLHKPAAQSATGEGFPVYFTSRAAIEVTKLALKDELCRAESFLNDWTARAERATGDRWRAQAQAEAGQAAARRDALAAALTALEG